MEAGEWARRLLPFSVAAFVGYSLAVAFWELWTPSWAGDHIGLSGAAILLYAIGALFWVAVANLVYTLVWFAERLLHPRNASTYRKYVHRVLLVLGAMSPLLWFAARTL